MNKSATLTFVIDALYVCLFFSISHAQGDNTYDPMVNCRCLQEATVTGLLPDGAGRGIPEDCVINESPSWWQIARSTVTYCKNREFSFNVLRRVSTKGDAG